MDFSIIAAEAPNGRFLPGDLREFYWATAAFLVIVAVMVKLAGPAIKSAFNGRIERIRTELETARADRETAEALLVERTADLPDLDTESERIRIDARETAAKLKADLISKAESDADSLRTRGQADVENLRRQAMADISADASKLTRASAEELVVDGMDALAHKSLIDDYITKVEAF